MPSRDFRAMLESTGTAFAVADYRARAVIFHQGHPSDSVLHIARGRVKLAVTARSGQEATCGLLGTGAFMGEEVLAGHAVRRQSATAMIATEVLAVPKTEMIRLLRTQPAIADRFLAHTLARNTHLEAHLTHQLLYLGEQRLAHTLLVLAGCDERRRCRCALPDISQEMIAEMIGTSRSRVNALMRALRKRGFIEKDGGVLRVNPSRLQRVQTPS